MKYRNGSNVCYQCKWSLSLAAPSTFVGATFLHFNLISGMPFNPKKKASSRLSQT
jgi:hypothetical protein